MQQSCHGTFCSIVHQCPDLLEMITAAGVGIRDRHPALSTRPWQVQCQAFALGRRGDTAGITQVGLVGAQDPVET